MSTTMRALARQASSLYLCSKFAAENTGRTIAKTANFKACIAQQPIRNLQNWSKNLSTEAAAKLAETPNGDNEINLETLGCSREKIEVDGMMINWDKAGNGEQVVLLLPGIIGP